MNRCVFLDRDGVINAAPPPGDYILRREDLVLLDQTVDWIRLFNTLGLLTIVVTNQRAVALGLLTQAELDAIHDDMRARLLARGARIDDVFCCPHEEDACDCRKPRPGLVLQAQRKWNIDLRASLLIGDTHRDEGLARRCGLPFVHVADGRILRILPSAQEETPQ